MLSTFKSLVLLSVAATGALAAAEAANALATSFKLGANVVKNDLFPSIATFALSVDPATGDAILTDGAGDVFFDSGTAVLTIQNGTQKAMFATEGGNVAVGNANVVFFAQGQGNTNVVPSNGKLYRAGGSWGACPASVLGESGDSILLRTYLDGQNNLAGCADIELIVTCHSDAPNEAAIDVDCYAA